MARTERIQSIHVDEKHREVHFEIGGLWDVESIKAFLREMDAKAAPMVMQGGPFSGLGIMRHLNPQAQDVAETIRRHLMAAREAGLARVAIIDPPLLMKMQYRRVSEGLDVQFFNKPEDGLRWLRDNA